MSSFKQERPIRLVGFGVSGLSTIVAQPEQKYLFPEFDGYQDQKGRPQLDQALDKLRDRYGRSSIRRGSCLPKAKPMK